MTGLRFFSKKRIARGYTMVELMMAITVFALGVSGIIAMQKVTLASNRHAKNLAIASHIGQAWLEQLAADAAHWNHPSAVQPGLRDITETNWLKSIESNPDIWLTPTWVPNLQFGAAFDALGNPTETIAHAHFCTHIRLNWLYRDNTPVAGNGLIRAEVRVFWRREGRASLTKAPICSSENDPRALGEEPDLYHFVYQTSAIRQNAAQQLSSTL